MNVRAHWFSGDNENSEDGAIFNPSFRGGIVVDGASAPYSPENPPVLFYGVTGGRMVADSATARFAMIDPNMPLEQILVEANESISYMQMGQEDLAGGSFACFQIKDDEIFVITGSDAFIVLIPDSKTMAIATPDQSFACEKERIDIFERIKLECDGDLKRAWNEYLPIYRKFRREQEGVLFASLNGMPSLRELWHCQVFSRPAEGGVLLAFTDGMAVFEETEYPEKFAMIISNLYREGGVKAILKHKREDEEEKIKTSHVRHQEATCMEVIF